MNKIRGQEFKDQAPDFKGKGAGTVDHKTFGLRLLSCVMVLSSLAFYCSSCLSDLDPLDAARYFAGRSEQLYTKAVESYQGALLNEKNRGQALYELGKIYFSHADHEKALEVLASLNSVEARKLTALCYYEMGQFTDALTIFNKLGELDDPDFLFHYARTCEQQNLYDQAQKIYQKITAPEYQPRAQLRLNQISALVQKTGLERLPPEIRDLIHNAPSSDQYPQAGAVLLFVDEEMAIAEDNTVEYVQHLLVKILNERGKHNGEIEIGYDSTFEKVEVDFARTIKPDGEVVSAGAKHVRDVSRYLNYPLYSNARVRIISMPEIAVGSFVEYQIRTKSAKMVDRNKFFTEYLLQSGDPIERARFTLKLPDGRKLNLKIINESYTPDHISLTPQVSKDGGRDVYTWEFRDIPQIIPEPGMPPTSEITPVILASTFESWGDIDRWWRGLTQGKTDPTDDIRQKVRELIATKKTLREKVRAIYNFCAREIRYVAVEYGMAGYEPHRAEEIFRNKYGDCKDKAVLLIAMLKEIGVKAYPVLIGTKGLIPAQKDFPTLSFNHCIALIDLEGERIFADPTAETTLLGDLPGNDQSRTVFVYFEDHGELMVTPKFAPERNLVKTTTDFRFDPKEKVIAGRKVVTEGTYDQAQRYRLRYTMPLLIEEGLKERIQALVPASRLKDYQIEHLEEMDDPIELSYRFEGTEFLVKAGEGLRVIPQLARVDLSLVSKDERVYPIDFNIPSVSDNVMHLTLPEHYRIESLPGPVKVETKWFDYLMSYDLDGNTLVHRERTVNKGVRVETEEYRDYKLILEKLSQDVRYYVILKRVDGYEQKK